jgi:hypothetical protein
VLRVRRAPNTNPLDGHSRDNDDERD